MHKQNNIFTRRLKRKSQMTLAIIAGLLILITVVAILYITEYVTIERIATQQLSSEDFKNGVDTIRSYIEKCIDDTGYNALVLLGNQGGYIDVPELINYGGTSYWYLDQVNIQPLLEEVRDRYEHYVDQNVPQCTNFDIFTNQGFEIKKGGVSTEVDFGTERVFMNISYPITIKKGGFEDKFDYFYKEYNIRFRRIYELASQINYRHMNPRFNVYQPLDLLYTFDFDVNNIPYIDGKIVYSIVDRTRFEYGLNNYTFRFAAGFGNSVLPRRSVLWGNSASVPSTNFFIVYSVDRMARLFMFPDTLMCDSNGNSVDEITTRQYYLDNATAYDIIYRGDYNLGNLSSDRYDRVWRLSYPVYSFEPTGARFSQPLPMFFYWDNNTSPNRGEIGILYNSGDELGWHPIDSNPVYNGSYVWTTAYGFSNFSIVDCGIQQAQSYSAKSKVKPKWPCFLNLLLDIVFLILVVIKIVGLILSFTIVGLLVVLAAVVASMAVKFVLNKISPPPEEQPHVTHIPPIIPSTGGALRVPPLDGFINTKIVAPMTPPPLSAPAGGFEGAGTVPGGGASDFLSELDKPTALEEIWNSNIGSAVLFAGVSWVLARFSYDRSVSCIDFTPTCDQYITITKEDVDGKGRCTLKSGHYEGGHVYRLCAAVRKCDRLKRYTCQSCSTKCIATFK